MLVLDLWGIGFHGVVVFGRAKNLLSKSILGLNNNVDRILLSFEDVFTNFEFDFLVIPR